MFSSRVTKEVIIKDGESDVIVTIRKLSGSSLEKASDSRQMSVAATMRQMGPEVLRSFQDESTAGDRSAAASDPVAAKRARYGAYDRITTLQMGIQGWSSNASLKFSPNAILDLDDVAAQKLFEEIVDLSVPTPEQVAAEGKDASSPSTSS